MRPRRPDPRNAFSLVRPTTPGEARGILPFVLAAIATASGISRAIEGNQTKQRNKGYISEAYRQQQKRQLTHEGDVRQGEAEALARRGLGGFGAVPQLGLAPGGPRKAQTRISAAMGPTPTTLGQQQRADTNRELGMEREDQANAYQQALKENNAAYRQQIIGAVGQTAQGVANAYTATRGGSGAEFSVPLPEGTIDQGRAPSPISAALASGGNPNAWGGIDPVNPFSSGSSWHPGGTLLAAGQQNAGFTVS